VFSFMKRYFFFSLGVVCLTLIMSGRVFAAAVVTDPNDPGFVGPPTEAQIQAKTQDNSPLPGVTGPPTQAEIQQRASSGSTGSSSSPSSTVGFSGGYSPISDVPGAEGQSGDFPTYVRNIYVVLMWLVGISALMMISVGGFWYMTSAGNTSRVNTGKEMITDAVIGLILALATWLILYTINPDLTRISFATLNLSNGTSGAISGTQPTAPAPGNTPKGPVGSCGGIKNNVGNQCELASADLSGMLACMAKTSLPYGPVTSVSARNIGANFERAKACCGGNCTHADNTCHYGCTTSDKGHSYAIDYAVPEGRNTNEALCQIAEAARNCGGGTKIWGPRNINCNNVNITQYAGHQDHLHIPTISCNH
jgi:hypothetical protein